MSDPRMVSPGVDAGSKPFQCPGMKRTSLMFVVALSLAAFGCKKKGADCDKAISHSMELSKANMSKMPGMDDKMLAKLKDVATTRCKEDKWSDDVLKCMSDAKTEPDAQACYGKMPKDQQDKMNKAMMDTMMAAMPKQPDMGSAGGDMAGSAAAGSADMAGSAAAGSADMAGSAAAGSAAK